MTFYVGTGDPPCSWSGDHQWRGKSACPSCGARLRCICGRFMAAEDMDAHIIRGDCPSIRQDELADAET